MERMAKYVVTVIGKSVRKIALLRGGSGSALPGLFVEKIDPRFISDSLAPLPHGVVVISGTNGKTTTTKMVVELLESQGLKVFTNRTGSNFTRGVAAALLGDIDASGKLTADIAVLELDEAHAVHFVKTVSPRYSLFLNVMRDQLDRFGEIDTTADFLHTVARATTSGIIINRDDPRLTSENFLGDLGSEVKTYGVDSSLLSLFPSDDTLRGGDGAQSDHPLNDDVALVSVNGNHATLSFDGAAHDVTLQLKGVYNILNSVGAVALTRQILGEKLDTNKMLEALERVTPAFGRGETLIIDGQPCDLVLVKNPSGFRLSLSSFDPAGFATMIAINDNYADGRDMSWLWDVEFDNLSASGVDAVTGMRAYDMALRLNYDDITIGHVDTSIQSALDAFIASHAGKPKRIYCTYTAMLDIRKRLSKLTTVEVVR